MSLFDHFNRTTSITLCVIAYVIAGDAAWLFVHFFGGELLWLTLVADVLATLVIFGFSTATGNASMYDPYWSIAPPLIVWFWLHKSACGVFGTANFFILLVVLIWAIRLTNNWLRDWRGLEQEDWRYRQLARDTGFWYPLVSLFGIHLFPTFMVFLGLLPVYGIVTGGACTPGLWFWTGGIICLGATLIEWVADGQLRRFKQDNPSEQAILETGLWRYCRHPNYFGEVSFWVGLYVMGLGSAGWANAWTGIGAVAMLCLFQFISIPLMEARHLQKRPTYIDYIHKTSRLIPWPPKH